MNGASRQVKNPLLSAAGPSFPYESYAENALLVPVTPTTSAVLRDDTELDNFVRQEPADNQSQAASGSHENSPTNASLQPKESRETASQPTTQGYFTSILSSLPNLSLSSIKNDSSQIARSQINQPRENIGGAESNPYVYAQGRHGSQPEIPGSLAINPQDSRSTDLLGFVALGPAGALPNPQQPAVPPSLQQTGDAPISYRLGNRRLKYAPPPDLKFSNTKPCPSPQTFFPTQNVSTAPTILNPYEPEGSLHDNAASIIQQITTLTEQLPGSEQLSRNSSLHSSFRSSPVASGTPYSTPVTSVNQNPFYKSSSVPASSQFPPSLSRPIPSRVPEPATPQNTPANVSFSGFVPFVNRDLLSVSNLEKVSSAFKNPLNSDQLNSPPEFPKDNTDGTNSSVGSGRIDATFTPISAAKVTEKLEHLLAEREEVSLCETTSETSSKVEEVTSSVADGPAKSFEPRSETLRSANEAVDKSPEKKVNEEKDTSHSRSNVLSDAFLGQEPTVQSTTSLEVHTSDESPILDIQAKSNVHPPQQYYQPAFPSSSNCYANAPADQKSSLNYVPGQFPQRADFYSSEQSIRSFFQSEASDTNRLSNFSQKNNARPPFGQPVADATNNLQRFQDSSAFVSTTIDSTACVSFQSADKSQVLNFVSNQSTYTAQPDQPSAPKFYNPTEFANELSKQPTQPHKYEPLSVQQPSSYNLPYGGANELQEFHAAREINNSRPTSIVPIATAVPEPTGSATLSPVQISVNSPINNTTTSDIVPPNFHNWASGTTERKMQYRPVYHHWFYRKEIENKTLWLPFSMQDSLKLEEIHNSPDITPETVVATDGGRYDVDILRRQRSLVYWSGSATEVRRCSWFYKGATESRYVPYDESTAVKLEEEYKQAFLANTWNRKVELNNGEHVTFHSATVQVHYLQPTSPEMAGSWGNNAGSEDSAYLQGVATRPRVMKRGVDEFNIDEGEPEKVDHLLFLVHGIGSVCDLKFRTVEEVVDEFRSISLQLVQSHYRTASEQRTVNRIEVLPISWHAMLHSEDTGIDKKLQAITLESIPKLRHFTNDTLLDILFYTSPVFCQTIMHTVGTEMNRLYALFKDRNPGFNGDVYIGGHSLGSLILFDLLCHQKPPIAETKEEKMVVCDDSDKDSENDSVAPIKPMPAAILKRRLSRKISYVMGVAGTGQPYINYPQLNFQPRAFFALGSPIGMFVTVRGIDTLGEDFVLPTCPAFFNIFHPFDPVAYRVESLINPEASKFRPMLIPHHKGRKRMHLELKETMARVGADLKQKFVDSVKSTWNSVYQLAVFHKSDNQMLQEIDKVVEEQLQPPSVSDQQNNDDDGVDLKIGKLNGGRRIDYVLQEAPFEYINEYIFALTSHICYWESEDTMLLILKEIYGSKGIQTDAQLPQQTMSVERISPSPSLSLAAALSSSSVETPPTVVGVDSTVPISNKSVGPPPKAGFVRKS